MSGQCEGNNDLLSLDPARNIISRRYTGQFLAAGVGHHRNQHIQQPTGISQADYGHGTDLVREINFASRLAWHCKAVADSSCEQSNPGQSRFVDGCPGTRPIEPPHCPPTSTGRSTATPAFTQLSETYNTWQLRPASLKAAADLLALVETVFDTLNCKAAIYRHRGGVYSRLDIAVYQLIISGTIIPMPVVRTLSGQTVDAFWQSIQTRPAHSQLVLNCALGCYVKSGPWITGTVAGGGLPRESSIRMPVCPMIWVNTMIRQQNMASLMGEFCR